MNQCPGNQFSTNSPGSTERSRRTAKKKEIKRPNAEDTPEVETPDIQRAEGLALTQKEFGNQVGTERKEQIDSVASGAQACRAATLHCRNAMALKYRACQVPREHHDESEEAQNVELREVEPFRLLPARSDFPVAFLDAFR